MIIININCTYIISNSKALALLDLHRTTYDILPIEMTYLAFGEIFLDYFHALGKVLVISHTCIHVLLQKRSRQFHTILYHHTRTLVLYDTQFF